MKFSLTLTKRRHAWLLAGAAVAICLILLVVFVMSNRPEESKRLVTFYDRGKQIVTLTHAGTVQGALDAADIRIHPDDVVEPSAGEDLKESYVDVIIYRSRLVAIDDGNIRQSVVTVAQSPNAILQEADLKPLGERDDAVIRRGNLAADRASVVLVVKRTVVAKVEPAKPIFKPLPNALTRSKGAQVFVDSKGVAHRETYYDLPMNVVIGACGGGDYTIRSDGAKIDKDGYVLVAANLNSYPRCSVVETGLGMGKVYDTGGFAVRHPYGFDLATDWTNYNGR